MSLKRNFLFGVILLILILPGCKADDTDATEPSNSRDQFLGTWTVTESVKTQAYIVNITAESNSTTGVYISNFGNAGLANKAHAVISGNSIVLSPTDQMMENEWIVNGNGVYSGTKINWSYTINDGADFFKITAIYSK
ncbi:MAG: hypothetical protein Q8867_03705 [Bacteroidota bacterium]|nr:hypothetical protein [Bacteroidota bacterium]